jgi:hypothetical protein
MIRLIKNLSIPLLFAFLSLTFIHFSYTLPHSHTDIKAIINLDDGKKKDQWDDEKKLPIIIQTLVALTTILIAGVTPLIYLFPHFYIFFIFLIPIFHQTNYVILPPESYDFNQ